MMSVPMEMDVSRRARPRLRIRNAARAALRVEHCAAGRFASTLAT